MEKYMTSPRSVRGHHVGLAIIFVCLGSFLVVLTDLHGISYKNLLSHSVSRPLPPHALNALERCQSLHRTPQVSLDFTKRSRSDRFVEGTKPILIKNAKVWTGGHNGTEVVNADILLDNGLIKGLGVYATSFVKSYSSPLTVIDANGSWVTPGIVDMHSHLGDSSSPELSGASFDDNSPHGPILPWLRALDGLNTHDDSYQLSISGGVTTALVLPGSANAIGGQGFTIKLRPTKERTPTSMLLEPPSQLNLSHQQDYLPWRYMKHACGENPSRVYDQTRMDTVWAFREAYNEAREIMFAQNSYCDKLGAGDWKVLEEPFPDSLQWESLVDVLRGRVKVQVHCYETVDLNDIVRLSNEFQFPISAFHHAHEAYLVPELLKTTYGGPPGVAMFATNARYKREAYRGSEFAPKILAQHGLKVVMKSDHPVLDSRHLLFEAQQAYYYGLPENLAIAAVTSTPADILGLGHRIGYIKEGLDADLVIWDSHPLSLGATPKQVFIDGIAQLDNPYVLPKPNTFQYAPIVPDFEKEARESVTYEGLPPLGVSETDLGVIVFKNISTLYIPINGTIQSLHSTENENVSPSVVVVDAGRIVCYDTMNLDSCQSFLQSSNPRIIDLEGGSISSALVTYGSPLGLGEMESEDSTMDGDVFDPLKAGVPSVMGGDGALVHAADGLQFGSRSALLAYRAGVTAGISAPTHEGFYAGLSTTFSTGASHKLAPGALIQSTNALHVSVRHIGSPSVSSQVSALRHMLLHPQGVTEAGKWLRSVIEGRTTLVVDADSADIIATIVLLKKEVESHYGARIKLTISGGLEAHLLAKELSEAHIGVIQVPSRPFPTTWERKRILPGPPLSELSSVAYLLSYNVTVGVGIEEAWSARNTRFDLGWLAIEGGELVSKSDAIAMGSTNLLRLLGADEEVLNTMDLVVTSGGDILNIESKVVAIISPKTGSINFV
ncbi:carbohydrate esterase family 9 protein [Abortiporus biennis]|nr:carbohydrate esterase family 9 protein [Abortiporus biennis]